MGFIVLRLLANSRSGRIFLLSTGLVNLWVNQPLRGFSSSLQFQGLAHASMGIFDDFGSLVVVNILVATLDSLRELP
jgi:hypothetical protein